MLQRKGVAAVAQSGGTAEQGTVWCGSDLVVMGAKVRALGDARGSNKGSAVDLGVRARRVSNGDHGHDPRGGSGSRQRISVILVRLEKILEGRGCSGLASGSRRGHGVERGHRAVG